MDHEFAMWLLGKTKEYEDNHDVIERYLSAELTDYITGRLTGKFAGVEQIELEAEEGDLLIEALNVIGKYSETGRPTRFWTAISSLLSSGTLELYEQGSRLLKEHLHTVPVIDVDKIVYSLTSGLRSVVTYVTEDVEDWLKQELNIVRELCKNINRDLNESALESLKDCLIELGKDDQLSNVVRDFAEDFIRENGEENAITALWGVLGVFEGFARNIEKADPYFNLLLELDNRNDDDIRDDTVIVIDQLARSNDSNDVKAAQAYLEKILDVDQYERHIERFTVEWLELIGSVEASLLKARIDFIFTTRFIGRITIDAIGEKIFGLIPLGGNQQQLQVIADALEEITSRLSDSIGLRLYQKVLSHIDQLGQEAPRYLQLTIQWHHLADPDDRKRHSSTVIGRFNSWPVEITKILPLLWPSMEVTQIQTQLIEMYRRDLGDEYGRLRYSTASEALDVIGGAQRIEVTEGIWNGLASIRDAAEQFMSVAIQKLNIDQITYLRNKAIASVTEHSANTTSELGLRLLASTIRSDVREVMSVVNAFKSLYERGEPEVTLANRFILQCLEPMDLRSSHKHKLAKAMSEAAARFGGEIEKEIRSKAKTLGLIGWRAWAYRDYWE